jgi:ribosomal protein L44E
MMTYRKALKHIREHAPEVEETFKTICRNRYCNPVRKWSIHDIAKRKKISLQSAERQYYRHFKRLHEIFGVSQISY